MNKQDMLETYEKLKQNPLGEKLQIVLDAYPEYRSPEFSYHNAAHARSVLAVFDLLVKLEGIELHSNLRHAARQAIVYHDIDHMGTPDSHHADDGRTNIERALDVFGKLYTPGADDELFHLIHYFIEYTEFPHTPVGEEEPYPEIVGLIRDADILWGLFPENFEVTLLGIWLEQIESGYNTEKKPCDIEALLVNQIKFIQQYEPYSKAGKQLKNALFNQATEGWATVALEFLRQMEAAEMVSEMATDQVFGLHKAIKDAISQPKH